ncbi:hypothetical protein GIB67_018332 [Kingdonia uniflora]|uniref:Uncharacterized protein n=1 Tax=Kingdonia uniflora TaxID=39325 RepID=A0A7J7MIZ2_9MAGN|nr:hypothetical protein GIB67_018332 [Kingdonia uniflora]
MMLSYNDEVEDVFYDSVDYIPSRSNSISSVEEESVSGRLELGYGVWINRPGSVNGRRERFIREMGLDEFITARLGSPLEISEEIPSDVNSLEELQLERMLECSGAIPSSCNSSHKMEKHLDYRGREHKMTNGFSPPAQNAKLREANGLTEEHDVKFGTRKKKIKNWWSQMLPKRTKEGKVCKSSASNKTNRVKVGHNKKKCSEFTDAFMGQEIQAHKGFIWTMKFSPDGHYLASGGEDGVVRIWRVMSANPSCETLKAKGTTTKRKFSLRKKDSDHVFVDVPQKVLQKVFKIEESPLQEFHGHTSDVLDLCWSKSNCLLSSSKDKTVRLWQVGSNKCLQVFYHNNYVTCIQFSPVDDGYFISGSIDGKVRIWEVSEVRVVDWADVRDIVTAICYQPDGKGFVVGSIIGDCRFYDASGHHLQLDAHICVRGGRKSSNNKITGFQFSPDDSRRVMITSADSKIRIYDGVGIIHKYKGLRNSGSQMSASFTSDGRHIISVGEDSRVYIWDYNSLCTTSSKHAKSVRSCEHFFFEGASVAIPWSEPEPLQILEHCETSSWIRDSDRFSLSSWFSMDGQTRNSATWPEEKLPLWTMPISEHHIHHRRQQYHLQHHQNDHQVHYLYGPLHHHYIHTAHMVIVAAGWDGVIKTFHNYGSPTRKLANKDSVGSFGKTHDFFV